MLTLAHRAMLGAGSRPKNDVGIIGFRPSGTTPAYTSVQAVDSSGNRYLATYSLSTLTVLKIAPDGSIVWQRKLAAGLNSSASGIALDSSGSCYVCGSAANTSGATNIFGYLAKYDASGTLQWQRKLSGPSVGARFTGVVISSSGDAYVVGQVDVSPPVAILAKYSTGGVLQWQNKLSHATHKLNAQNSRLTLDTSGNLCFAATHEVSTYDTYAAGFVVSAAGALITQRQMSRIAFSGSSAQTLLVDASGNWYTSSILPKSGSDFYRSIAKLNSSGAVQWCFAIENNSVGLSGLLLDGSTLYAAGGNQWMKFATSDGALQMQRQLLTSGGGNSSMNSPMVIADNRLYVAGTLQPDSSGYAAAATYSFPTDGEGLGTYGTAISYTEPTFSKTTFTMTVGTPSYAISTSTYTEAVGGMTDSAASMIATPEVKTA